MHNKELGNLYSTSYITTMYQIIEARKDRAYDVHGRAEMYIQFGEKTSNGWNVKLHLKKIG